MITDEQLHTLSGANDGFLCDIANELLILREYKRNIEEQERADLILEWSVKCKSFWESEEGLAEAQKCLGQSA
jgi:hypothetical protein